MREASVKWPDGPAESPEVSLAASVSPAGAIRSWLVGGTRRFAIDPGRLRGGHRQARQLLAEDGQPIASTEGAWRDLVSALQRHTAHMGLTQLSQEERQILTMAYLQGHTNREIAAMLAVSVSTVRRRLSTALERLEGHLRHTGNWVSIGLLVLAAFARRTSSSGRSVATAHSAAWPNILATTAVGAATAFAFGLFALSPDAVPSKHPSSPGVARVNPFNPLTEEPLGRTGVSPLVPDTVLTGPPPGTHPASGQAGQSSRAITPSDSGCDGNPTNAAPAVPVGSSTEHPQGAPVTHPTAGGCGPNGTEAP